ncbi:Hypothetical predicted protein [Cloeon dipterum]|uniref:RPA43 OB domain-containing protein n=1 Tax=Cloeon dipterum TaxID=197152 RepID=A0A8S1CXC3_9INSE|nr:Hypothetical predicted protein [Cloeon dipterum]
MEIEEHMGATSEGDACVWVHCVKELYLQPHYFNQVQKGVGDAMNATINKYQGDLAGVVRQHKNVKLLSVDGTITDEESYIKLQVEADFEVFRPFVGCKLKGVVNKVSANNVSCLVHELFNVSCPNTMGSDDWVGYNAVLGQEITCQVTKVDLSGRIPYIRASIVKLHQTENGNHKHFNDEEEEEVVEEEPVETPKKKKKKKDKSGERVKEKKKKKHDSEEEASSTPKKKSKSRREDVSSESEVIEIPEIDILKALKRKRKSGDLPDSPRPKSKKRKLHMNEAGDKFYYDDDGGPIFV